MQADSFVAGGTTLNVPDSVFGSDYRLMPLVDLKNYLARNHHLPGMPDAKEIKTEGTDLARFQMKLLERIEVLTLYALAQHETLLAQKRQIAALERKLGSSARLRR